MWLLISPTMIPAVNVKVSIRAILSWVIETSVIGCESRCEVLVSFRSLTVVLSYGVITTR